MVYRKKTYGKSRGSKSTGRSRYGRGRGAGGTGRGGRTVPYRKKTYARGIRVPKKKMVRGKKSSSSSFRKAVIRALATTNTNIYEQAQRITFNGGTKQSGFNYAVGTGAWATEYYPPDMMADLVAQAREELPTPVGTGVTGFSGGAPIDVYCTRSGVSMTVTSCYQLPIFGRWYCFSSRFDGQDYDPVQQYSNDIANIQGSVASSLGQPVTADLIGSTPFNFRSVCQTYKIRAMSKVFRLEPGQPRRFKHTSKKVVHITPRMIGINAMKHTKFFMFEFWGMPINDSANKNNVNTSGGAVDVVCTQSQDYEFRPIPNTYKVFNADTGTVTTPSALSLNTIVAVTAPIVS